MAKTKEQVKYNPRLSAQRRLSKVKRAISPANTVFTLIFVVLAGINMGIMGYDVFFEADSVLTDVSETIGIVFSSMFILLFIFVMNVTLPSSFHTPINQKQQQAFSKGCVYIHEVLAHMPVTKVMLYRQSFRGYLFFMVGSSVPVIILNILIIISNTYDAIAPYTVIATVMEAFVMVLFYLGYFCIFYKNVKLMKKLLTIGVAIFYIVWFGSMFGFLDFLANFETLGVIAGVPSLCITLAAIAAVIIIEKCVLEKKAVNAPWEFYTEEIA